MAAETRDDPTHERRDGPTPAGGVRSVLYYRDAAGAPVPKSRAVAAEGIEYDADGGEIARTYLTIERGSGPLARVIRHLRLKRSGPSDGGDR